MRIATIGAVTVLAWASALPVPSAQAGVSKTFGEWAVSCTDGLTCTAWVSRTGSEPVVSVGIRRSIDPAVPASLVIALDAERKLTGDVGFAIDGAEPIRIPAARFAAEENGAERTLAETDGAAAVRTAMRDGQTVRAEMQTSSGSFSADFPLKGLAASLLFMDEAQKRDGTTLAFVARGDKAAPDPAGLPKDIANRTELPASVAKLWEVSGCSDVDEANTGTLGFSTPITGGRLFGLICGSPGAYNVNYALFADYGDNAEIVPLPGMTARGPVAAATVMNLDWDDRARRAESFVKYRGLGDCGLWQSWAFDPEGGSGAFFVLAEAREKADCDGKGEDIDKWTALWPPGK